MALIQFVDIKSPLLVNKLQLKLMYGKCRLALLRKGFAQMTTHDHRDKTFLSEKMGITESFGSCGLWDSLTFA